MISNDLDALIHFAAAGLGITMMPDFMVEEEVADGRLVRLTKERAAVVTEVFAVTSEGRAESQLRVLSDFLIERVRPTLGR
ncbi:MAG: LysR substrate-binding domain-containing protein [Myxococcota bacterium]